MISPHMTSMYKKIYNKRKKVKDEDAEKLILNLNNKYNYVDHIKTLQLYIQLGLKITKIHRVVEFEQSDWLKEWIDYNTEQRKQAKTDYEKDFFKLMNNAVYGKTMEDVKNHMNYDFACNEDRFQKLVNSPRFQNLHIMNQNVAGVQRTKNKILLNKPIAVGVASLSLSKCHMYNFFIIMY